MAPPNPFALDTWVREFKPKSKASLHDTCVVPLSLQELGAFGDHDLDNISGPVDDSAPLTYGATLGKPQLQETILDLYRPSTDVNAVPKLYATVTSGCISANYLVLSTLLGPGDHMIVQYPCYQQFFEVPRRMGADVSLWKTSPENQWQLDLSELHHLVKPNTKLLMINTPNNPTGAMIPKAEMEKIVDFAKQHRIVLLCDEIFRWLHHPSFSATDSTGTSSDYFPSVMSFTSKYDKILATSSLSKTFRLPGIRVGWVVSPDKALIDAINVTRDYTTISVSQIDQDIATFALNQHVRSKIVESSLAICQTNSRMLEAFINKHDEMLEWVKPLHFGGSCAFIRVRDSGITDQQYCEDMLEKSGLLVVPGGWTFGNGQLPTSELDYKGYLRVGFVCSPEQFRNCLDLWASYLRSQA